MKLKKILMSCVLACGGLTIMMGSDLFACGELKNSPGQALERSNYVQEPRVYKDGSYDEIDEGDYMDVSQRAYVRGIRRPVIPRF